jgi:anti-sigma regulatory factor (Ser/Thr protein kinase)
MPATANAVRFARRMVHDLCDLQGVGEIADLACLLAGEVVTNAVRHTRTRVLRVDAEVTGETLRVSVSDGDPQIPTVLAPSESDVSGRGLLLVDALSTDWGVTQRATGKTVWFTICGSDVAQLKLG